MKGVNAILDAVATFTGSTQTAGLLLYVTILVLILVFMRSAKSRFFFIALPVTLIMSMIGVLKSDVMYLMLILNVLGIVIQYRRLN